MKRIEPVDKVCQQLLPEEVYKQFGRASKLLLHPKDMPDVKLVEEKEAINCENRLEDRKDDNVIMCELTEQLDSHEKAEHSINIIIPTKIVHDAKEHTYLSDYSENLFNHLGSIGSGEVSSYEGEHTGQWTFPKKSTYPSDYGEKLFDCLGGVEEEGGYLQWTRIADNHEVHSKKMRKNRLFTLTLRKGI